MSEVTVIGIENLKLMISLPIELGNIADKIGKEKEWKRWLNLIDALDEVVDVLKVDWKQLQQECADLSEAEKAELYKHISEKFDIANDKLEGAIEKSILILVTIASMVKESIDLFRALKA